MPVHDFCLSVEIPENGRDPQVPCITCLKSTQSKKQLVAEATTAAEATAAAEATTAIPAEKSTTNRDQESTEASDEAMDATLSSQVCTCVLIHDRLCRRACFTYDNLVSADVILFSRYLSFVISIL
jgi:hypothetical protein